MKGFLLMVFVVGLVGVLLLFEFDMGVFMVVVVIVMGVLFFGGVNGKLFGGFVVMVVGMFMMFVWLLLWCCEWIFVYFDLWDECYV